MAKLILLHGALANRKQFDGLVPLLNSGFHPVAIDFSGHGTRELGKKTFNLDTFCEDIAEAARGAEVHLFGYSMGGYVAMWYAKKYPGQVKSVLTLATKYRWNSELAASECMKLNYEQLEQKAPGFIAALTKQHTATDTRQLLQNTSAFLTHLGVHDYLRPEALSAILHPVCTAVGDRDKMVTLEETLASYQALPNGQLCVLPATPHLFEKMQPEKVAALVNTFFQQ